MSARSEAIVTESSIETERPRWISPSEGFPGPQSVREYLQRTREYLDLRQKGGAKGSVLVQTLSNAMDDLLRNLFAAAEREYFSKRSGEGKLCALTGVGGYGRRELFPYSDIDLLFLYPHRIDAYMEFIAERMLYALWDAGLEVGHSIRTIDQCLHIAGEDSREATSMLDVRSLAGREDLVQELVDALYRKTFSKKDLEDFSRIKIDDLRARHQKFGESVYLIEPNVKQGRGGMRDLNTIEWLLKAHFKLDLEKAIRMQGLLSPEDLESLAKAKEYMTRVRFFLHSRSGRRQDILDFESQAAAAVAFGFKDTARGLAVEQFMQQYYQNAAEIERYVEGVIDRLAPSKSSRARRLFRRVTRKNLDHGMLLHGGYVTPGREDLFKHEPLALISIFRSMQEHEAQISPSCRDLVRKHLDQVNDDFRTNPAAAQIFRNILSDTPGLFQTLEAMHRSGFLSAYIPEFAHLHCLVLHDLYHIYTVDTHLLFAVQQLEGFTDKTGPKALRMAREVFSQVQEKGVLALAILFHDIGKGLGKGHSERGAAMMPAIAQRLGYSPTQIHLLEELVRHHLMMAHITQRRDFREPKILREFCEKVQTPEMLRCLYLLTICDIRAVSSEVWTDWKGSLLGELYLRALHVLEEGIEAEERVREDLQGTWREVQRLSPVLEKDAALSDNLFQVLPPQLLENNESADLARFLRVVLERPIEREKGPTVAVQGTVLEKQGCFEIVVHTFDQKALFATISGVLAAQRLNILSVDANTWSDGRVLDVFRVVDGQGRSDIPPDVVRRVERDLGDILQGKKRLEDLKIRAKGSRLPVKASPRALPAQVTIRNDVSEFSTIVEVFARDRIGLLHEISKVFAEMGLTIQRALISTDVDQVADVFYLKDRMGHKLVSTELQDDLRMRLLAVLAVPPA